MSEAEPQIQIFKPFNDAFELTKKVLFQPFELGKWCVIGFAAFLAQLSGGYGYNFRFGGGGWNPSGTSGERAIAEQIPAWIWVTILAIVIPLALAVTVVLMWVGARGRFIFTDCVVHNRGAIVQPWRDYRKEGNSFFLCTLLVILILFALIALAAIPAGFTLYHTSGRFSAALIVELVIMGSLVAVVAVCWILISSFMIPIMYRQRCRAAKAFGGVISLVRRYPGEIVLFCLFGFVLGFAAVFIVIGVVCATCCIALIPYVGTVILLPVYVFFAGFKLLYLKQFGPEYDVWAGMIPAAAPPPDLPPPPPSEDIVA